MSELKIEKWVNSHQDRVIYVRDQNGYLKGSFVQLNGEGEPQHHDGLLEGLDILRIWERLQTGESSIKPDWLKQFKVAG